MENKIYKTSDLNIASFLLASGQVSLTKSERSSDNTVHFYFSPKELAQKLVEAYWADSAPSIQPRKLFGARRDLQDLVFGGR